MNKRPILIIAALDVEVRLLLEKMDKVKMTKLNKYTCYEGNILEYPIVICNCLSMSINAAISTTLAIQKYNPIAIVNEGTAGRTWFKCS